MKYIAYEEITVDGKAWQLAVDIACDATGRAAKISSIEAVSSGGTSLCFDPATLNIIKLYHPGENVTVLLLGAQALRELREAVSVLRKRVQYLL